MTGGASRSSQSSVSPVLATVVVRRRMLEEFDEDKTFGAVDLRRAFNEVRVLDRHGYGNNGEWVGLDVKAMRTQKQGVATRHLSNSREVFMALLELVRSLYPQAHFATVYAKPKGEPQVDTFITGVSQDTWIFFPWDMALQYVEPYRGKE